MQKMTTGKQIRQAREELGWTQGELAEAVTAHGAPVSKPFISLLEADERRPAIDTAAALSVVLNIPLDDLLAEYKVPAT